MVFAMARPSARKGTTNRQFTRRVPADVIEVAKGKRVLFSLPKSHSGDDRINIYRTFGDVVSFSLQTSEASLAKLRHSAAQEQFERACSAFRAGPQRLKPKQIYALGELLYRNLNDAFEDDPVSGAWWSSVRDATADALNEPLWPPLNIGEPDNGSSRRLKNVERFVGPLIDPILTREGVIVAPEDRPAVLMAVGNALTLLSAKLARNAVGDYSEDTSAQAMPKWTGIKREPAKATNHSSVTLDDLFDRWRKHPEQRSVTPSTLASYSSVFRRFRLFTFERVGRNLAVEELGKDDFRAFIDMRSTRDGVSPKTINGVDMAAINSVLNWAAHHDLIRENSALGVKRRVRKGNVEANKGRKTINDEEAHAILRHALAVSTHSFDGNPKLRAAKRWLPWLMAYTGNRVGEVAQLRKQDVGRYEGHPSIKITPEAGTVKNKSTWHIPIHPHLIEQGFLAFVEEAPAGHLFLTPRPDRYNPDAKLSRTSDERGILGPLQALKNRLSEFVREVMQPSAEGGPRPNHGWRHRFKAGGLARGIDGRVLDAFNDHAAATASEGYGRDDMYKAMVSALDRLPRYEC